MLFEKEVSMIVSFGSKDTEKIWGGERIKKIGWKKKIKNAH
jgi:hypothetical protein